MQNTKKLLFTAILALSALAASESNCSAKRSQTLFIKTVGGGLIPVENILKSSTVADLKKQILVQYGYPIEEQHIIINGKEAKNAKTKIHPQRSKKIALIVRRNQKAEQQMPRLPKPRQQRVPRLPSDAPALPAPRYMAN